jgi:hypothetical protein
MVMVDLKNVIVLEDWAKINDHIVNLMTQDKPLFFGRIGGSDTQAVKEFYDYPDFMDRPRKLFLLDFVKQYNGYFDFSDKESNYEKYLSDMLSFYKNSDDCSYIGFDQLIDKNLNFLECVTEGKTLINYGFIESVLPFMKSFFIWAENKKILFINPFSKSIEYQWKNKDHLYLEYKFPNFELKTYNTVITYNTKGDTKNMLQVSTDNWHEECQRMADEISKIDFDIAIMSCASYGMYLGTFIRDVLKKKAIYLGGIINVYFNIYGGRYDEIHRPNYYKDCGLNPDFMIDPFENDDIKDIIGGREHWSESLNAYFGKRNKL